MSTYRKKLIEVAMPLDVINTASVREGYIYRGHPTVLHKWWAQRPAAACSAVLFGQLVDDPSSCPDEFRTRAEQEGERNRLFSVIERLSRWENRNSVQVLDEAREEIARSIARARIDSGSVTSSDTSALEGTLTPSQKGRRTRKRRISIA